MKSAPELFGRERALIGMVHLAALPGTPRSSDPVAAIVERAVTEARLLADAGFDAVVLENMHDTPYLLRDVGPEIVAAMTAAAAAVRATIDLPLGLQVLAGANREAVAIAHATGCTFVRAEGFVFASVADEGLMDAADAGPLLRYRRAIDAGGVAVLADIKKKHSAHALTADVDIAATARAAEFFDVDGIVVTGAATGAATDLEELARCRAATELPLVCGSGTTPENIAAIFAHADAAIVGSWFKRGAHWSGAPDPDRARALVEAAREARVNR
ncbi:MAG: BtpA/SgcQ family protein [bacterium]|nr:BtpA/SgcQ family protein [bacterium]